MFKYVKIIYFADIVIKKNRLYNELTRVQLSNVNVIFHQLHIKHKRHRPIIH